MEKREGCGSEEFVFLTPPFFLFYDFEREKNVFFLAPRLPPFD